MASDPERVLMYLVSLLTLFEGRAHYSRTLVFHKFLEFWREFLGVEACSWNSLKKFILESW